MENTHNNESQISSRILIGLIVGAIIGLAFNYWGANVYRDAILKYVMNPMGQIFLRGLFMVVVPLVFSSLIVGVTNLGSANNVGRLGWRLAVFYILTTLVAILIGQTLIELVRPGDGISPEYLAQAQAQFAEQVSGLESKSLAVKESLWPGLVNTIVPKNIISAFSNGNMLAIIFVAILFGLALLTIDKRKAQVVITFADAVTDVTIKWVGWFMKLAPYAVAALMISAVTHFGLEFMTKVGKYILVVVTGYAIHMLVTYSLIIKYIVKIPVREFYRRMMPVIATAFSTSSSSATMPTTIRNLEKRFGLPESLTTFSIPLGTTINMDGTALFEVIAALFVAQVYGIDISLTGHITLVLLVLLTSIGVAGVPGGSIPILMSAMATLGIPAEGIALVLGVDRLLDMGRTVVNVTGDSTAALFLARVENIPLKENLKAYD